MNSCRYTRAERVRSVQTLREPNEPRATARAVSLPRHPARRRLAALLMAAALTSAAGCAATDARDVVHQEQPWEPAPTLTGLHLQTDRYDFYTTARDGMMLEYVPVFLETAFADYQKVMAPPTPPDRRLPVYLFDNRQQWARFTSQFVPDRANVYLRILQGGYMDAATNSVVIWDLGRDRTLALLAHEGWHQYLSAYFPSPVPAWLNEGLATQFEAFDLRGARPTFTPRNNLHRKNSLREALRVEGAWIELDDLLTMHAGHAVLRAGQATRGYYAQLWALTLFLRSGPERQWRQGFEKLLDDIAANRMVTRVHGYRAVTPQAQAMPDSLIVFKLYISEDLHAVDNAYRQFAAALVN